MGTIYVTNQWSRKSMSIVRINWKLFTGKAAFTESVVFEDDAKMFVTWLDSALKLGRIYI